MPCGKHTKDFVVFVPVSALNANTGVVQSAAASVEEVYLCGPLFSTDEAFDNMQAIAPEVEAVPRTIEVVDCKSE